MRLRPSHELGQFALFIPQASYLASRKRYLNLPRTHLIVPKKLLDPHKILRTIFLKISSLQNVLLTTWKCSQLSKIFKIKRKHLCETNHKDEISIFKYEILNKLILMWADISLHWVFMETKNITNVRIYRLNRRYHLVKHTMSFLVLRSWGIHLPIEVTEGTKRLFPIGIKSVTPHRHLSHHLSPFAKTFASPASITVAPN